MIVYIKNIYKETEDKTSYELKNIKSFLYRGIKNYRHYGKMLARPNQNG